MTIFGVLLIVGAYFQWTWMVRGFIVNILKGILGWNGMRIVFILIGLLLVTMGVNTLMG